MTERIILSVGFLFCVGVGVLNRVHREPLPANVPPDTPEHRTHAHLQCTSCHTKDAKHSVSALLCADCHHPLQTVSAELDVARDAYFAGGCASCHPVEGSLRRRRPGPDLREARIKLTREWAYRFLTEPWAWNAQAPPGPHHLAADKDLPTKARAMVTALCGNRDRQAHQGRPSDAGEKLLNQSNCRSCHTLAHLGSKLSRAWLDAFLRAPRAHAADAHHPDPHWNAAESTAVIDTLLSDRDARFEPRWPVLDRVTVDTTDRLLAKLLPDVDLQSAGQSKREAALGARLLVEEGCAGCHALLGNDAAEHVLKREPRKKDRVHAMRYSSSPEAALSFVSAMRRHEKSTWWPLPRLPSADGGALARETGCQQCHESFKHAAFCEWDKTLTSKGHDFGLDAQERAAVIGHFAGDHVCQGIR